MSLTLSVVVVLGVVAGCHGNTFKMGACPRVTVMEQMDFDKFLGEWFVVQKFNPLNTCTKLLLEKGEDGTYSVNETSRPLGLNFGYHNKHMKARKLTFLKNDTNSIFRIERNFVHFTISTFGVVDTDYENYAIVWGCDPVLFGNVQNVDILSRKQSPDESVIKSAKDLIKEMNIDLHPLDNVDHSHCIDSEDDANGSTGGGDRNTNNIVIG